MRWWLGLVVLAACGDSLTPGADGGVDGAAEEDPFGLVEIKLRSDADVQGHLVMFQNADSSLALATRTDGAGRANAFMAAGGFVTLVVDRRALTYGGVEPGTELTFEHWTDVSMQAQTSVRVRVPPFPGATSYRLFSPCGAREIFGAHLQTLDISLGQCPIRGDLIVVATAPDGPHFVVHKDVVFGSGDPIVFLGPYQNEEIVTITATGGEGTIPVLARSALVSGGEELLPARGTALVPVDGVRVGLVSMPVLPLATLLTHVQPQNTGDAGTPHTIEWQPATTNVMIDLEGARVRAYSRRPTYAERSAVEWDEEPDGDLASGVLVELRWIDPDLGDHAWLVLSPRSDAPEVRLPVLPVRALRPFAERTEVVRLDNMAIEGGWERLRASFQLGKVLAPGMWFVDSAAGRVVYESLD